MAENQNSSVQATEYQSTGYGKAVTNVLNVKSQAPITLSTEDGSGATKIVMLRSETRFNSNTFGIDAHDSIMAMQLDTGIIPSGQPNYIVYNIGRTEVYAELKYGTKVMWHGIADTATVQPGEKKELDNGHRPYYVTGLKIYNKTGTRAIVHCATWEDKYTLFADKESGAFDEIRNELIKQVVAFGLKQIPYIGTGLSGLVTAFWPNNKPSAWEEVEAKVKALVDEKILQTISGILSGDVRYFRDRIRTLSDEIESGGTPENLRIHYMNIAQDLIGFENKFKFTSDTPDYQNVNQYILPHFSVFMLMKISFYVIGIRQSNKLGLSEENLKNIKSYADKAIYGEDGANKYIEDLLNDRVTDVYNTWYPEDLYDRMMNVRTFIATQGLEYIRIWNHMIENPLAASQNPYNDVISYSTFFGRQTSNLINETTLPNISAPLTPSLVNGKRNKLKQIDIYIWRIYGTGAARIGGQKLVFENGEEFVTGTRSSEVFTIEVGTSTITKLEAFGNGAVDYLVFHFSDGRIQTCGRREIKSAEKVFELKDHHIVSMYIASDNYSLGGQAANIAVSYQLNEFASPSHL